jgi:hypothetical protein
VQAKYENQTTLYQLCTVENTDTTLWHRLCCSDTILERGYPECQQVINVLVSLAFEVME